MRITKQEIENMLLEYGNKRQQLITEFYEALEKNDKEKAFTLSAVTIATIGKVELLRELLEKYEE